MTDTDLIAQANAALDGVTEGPWRTDDYCDIVSKMGHMIADLPVLDGNPSPSDAANARFIAAARHLVPALRDALAAALTRAELAECHAEAMEAERDKANAEWAEAQSAATYNAEYVDLALEMSARVQALGAEKEQASLAAWRAAFETAADIAERRINAGRAESVPESLRVQARIGQPEEYRATLTGEAGG